MSKKKKVKSGFIAGLGFVGSILLMGLFFGGVILTVNIITHSIFDNDVEPVTEILEAEDVEAILVATKDKGIDSNIWIQCNYGELSEVGSGTIISEDDTWYYAITNEHLLDGNGNSIDTKQVITSDGVATDFEIVKISEERDLAYIRFLKENRASITPINFGSNIIHLDSLVVAIGNPYGNNAVVNYGKIIKCTYLQELDIQRTAIEHDAALANGSSGGSLLDMYGNFIGINTWKLDGFYYAIPLSVIQLFLEE